MPREFIHLHVHSDYSLLDGACRHDPLIETAKSMGMPAVALTDHGNLFGAMEFYSKAVKAGVKPILGCEVYTVPGDDENAHQKKGQGAGDYNHLLLLCESYEGWKNLQRLVSEGYRSGFYYKPRVSHHLLRKYSRGLIATSACLKGEVSQAILRGRDEEARRSLERLREIFGEKNLYVEVQANGVLDQRRANKGLLEIAKALSLPLVMTGDVHYLRESDKKAQDVLVCINTGKLLADEKRMRFDADLHFRSQEEMARACLEWGLPEEALASTVEIARRCNVDLQKEQWGRTYLPRFAPPEDAGLGARARLLSRALSEDVPPPAPGGEGAKTPEGTRLFFRDLCEEGLIRRYGSPLDERVRARYREELAVVEGMGFVPYLLIVWDFIRWAKSRGIPVGPGRGSAAGSILCYAIGITDIDPLAYDLLFERFLNKERVSMPDIDVDFCQERRGEVIDYVREKYGREAVAQIITFGTMAAKSVIRDVGRVLGVPLSEVDKVAKLVPGDLQVKHKKLRDAFAEVPELAALRADPKFAELFSIAESLEGSVRNASTHAAGVVIGDTALEERVPLYVDPKSPGEIVTQFPMTLLEKECGLIKMDFLGLKTLTVVKWALDMINEGRPEGERLEVSADRDPIRTALANPQEPRAAKLYELLCRGETKGVFQFESSGYRDLLQKLKPDGFEDIIALGAMYRPGPLGAGMVDAYVNRKHGKEAVTYLHPLLEKVLGTTYGCMLYQEQIMRITNVLAGFSLSQADSLRKAMGKKKPEEMAKYKGKFLEGAAKADPPCPQDVAEKIWEQMEFFAGYGFNRSHSAAYGLVTLQTAWLKANYREEFMAALISSEVASIEKVVEYVDEAERMGIEVLPPDVQSSGLRFSVVRGKGGRKAIRYGLIAIRGLGEKAIEAILAARREAGGRFSSIYELCERVDLKCLNKAAFEALNKAGALLSLGSRAQVAAVLEKAIALGQRIQADKRSGQASIFDLLGASAAPPPPPPLPRVPEWPEPEVLLGEKECLGFYLSSHPLKKHRPTIQRYATPGLTQRTLARAAGREVVLGGMVAQVRTRIDRTGKMMAFLTLEDPEGKCDAIVFSSVYEAAKAHLFPDAILLLRGKVDTAKEEPSLLVSEVVPIEKADLVFAAEVRIDLAADAIADERLKALMAALAANRGEVPVTLEARTKSGLRARIRLPREAWVSPTEALTSAVEAILGAGTCRICGAQAAVETGEEAPEGGGEGALEPEPEGALSLVG
jgi:DNA polymerase-3 subunit alpha